MKLLSFLFGRKKEFTPPAEPLVASGNVAPPGATPERTPMPLPAEAVPLQDSTTFQSNAPERVPMVPHAEPPEAPPSTTFYSSDPVSPTVWTSQPQARVRWRPDSFPMAVVGESSYQDALISLCGPYGRSGTDAQFEAMIELELTNPHDPNAVAVAISGRKVGYLPREQAGRVGGQMREEGLRGAACGARVRGGWWTSQYDNGQYGVYLAIPERGWIDFGIGSTRPSKPATPPRQKVERPEAAETGPLLEHRIALIGAPRDSGIAQKLAAQGAHIMAGPGSSTTLLVVNEKRPFSPGMVGSANYRKAEELIASHGRLRIVSLDEVWTMIAEAKE